LLKKLPKNTVSDTHSHPSGTKEKNGRIYSFDPSAPSKPDIQRSAPGQTNVVIDVKTGHTYLYNQTGVIAVLPTKRYIQ
jgi:hypothetical protein